MATAFQLRKTKAALPPSTASTSLDYTQHNCNSVRPRRRGCGAFTVVGSRKGKYEHIRLKCKSYRCGVCGPRKIRQVRKRIVNIALKEHLDRFLTLTLDPSKLNPQPDTKAEITYLKNCWRKMRVYIERKLGKPLVFISAVELQKSGHPHLHLLIGSFLPQAWISSVWDSLGGGKIVDIRRVKMRRVAAYLAKYITDNAMCDYPPRVRRFSTSYGLALFDKNKSQGNWRLIRAGIEILRKYASGVEEERYDAERLLSFTSTEPLNEFYLLDQRYRSANKWSDLAYIHCTGRRIVPGRLLLLGGHGTLTFFPPYVATKVDYAE